MSYLLNDYELSPSFAIQNGVPYSAGITTSTSNIADPGYASGYGTGVSTSYNGTNGAVRVPGIQRNAFRQPSTSVLDMRGSKRFTFHDQYQFEFFVESFNLLNQQNTTAVNTTAYTMRHRERSEHAFVSSECSVQKPTRTITTSAHGRFNSDCGSTSSELLRTRRPRGYANFSAIVANLPR